jgi:hypothetical protein
LLSDFETPRAKLLTIILAGQPELAGKLASPSLSQLRQRISIVNRLEPLPVWEVKDYIEHRLKVAGYEGQPIFTAEALERIAHFTDGIPRNVNNFCFNALSLACALRHKTVDLSVVEEVISDLDITKHLADINTAPVQAPTVVPDKPQVEKLTVISDRPKPEAPVVPVPDKKPVTSVSAPPAAVRPTRHENFSPAEAQAYMEELARRLKGLTRPETEAARSRGSGEDWSIGANQGEHE